ncbi:hypothetical protein Hanom_Chr12g01109371 [Helianthus anomalus]
MPFLGSLLFDNATTLFSSIYTGDDMRFRSFTLSQPFSLTYFFLCYYVVHINIFTPEVI